MVIVSPTYTVRLGRRPPPVVDLQVLLSLSKSMPSRNKSQTHTEKTVLKMRGNCQVCVVYYSSRLSSELDILGDDREFSAESPRKAGGSIGIAVSS